MAVRAKHVVSRRKSSVIQEFGNLHASSPSWDYCTSPQLGSKHHYGRIVCCLMGWEMVEVIVGGGLDQ